MENLSPESKALYDLLRAETTEEYEARFLAYKKETLDAVHKFVATTTKEIKAVSTEIEAVRTAVNTDLEAVKSSLSIDLTAVKESLSSEIASLSPRP